MLNFPFHLNLSIGEDDAIPHLSRSDGGVVTYYDIFSNLGVS